MHVGGQKLLASQLYSVTASEGVYLALRYLLRLKMQDIQTLPDLAFDTVRNFVILRGELGPATSGRIRDIAAIPGTKEARGRAQWVARDRF